MELTLTSQTGSKVAVACEGQESHSFDLTDLYLPQNPDEWLDFLDDPAVCGEHLYQALFPPDKPARQALETELKQVAEPRLVLVATEPELQAIPWEYAHNGRDFLVQHCRVVRGLPPEDRRPVPTIDMPLYIVAVPSDPLGENIRPLKIDGEWARLTEVILEVGHAVTLERVRPPTLQRLGDIVAGKKQRVIHFMGHGTRLDGEAALLFENNHAAPEPEAASNVVQWVRQSAFLVTLNACVTAAPGPTLFSNLAGALVQQGIPYVLGMQFVIADEDALTLSRTFYSMLARGLAVEEAVHRTRLALLKSAQPWAIGVPVLYTSLQATVSGFRAVEGTPIIQEHQPPKQIETALPRAQDTFRGRTRELLAIGRALTGTERPRLLTIHGGGGQGKTALAREAVERFAWAWPGGVWAISLEKLPSRAEAVLDLARFLGVETEHLTDPTEIERQTLRQLATRRVLVVLDNAETLVEAVEGGDETARDLAAFFRESLNGTRTGLVATSHRFLGWAGEEHLELGDLSDQEGAVLFRQHAPIRQAEVDMSEARRLSHELGGNPLALILLGSTFDTITEPMQAFVYQHLDHLQKAQDIYKDEDHRHRTLYASIDTNVRHLDDDLRALLSGLWVFRAPFLPESTAEVFDALNRPAQATSTTDEPVPSEEVRSPVFDQLYALWSRGLLTRTLAGLAGEDVLLYRLLPTVRLYVEQWMIQTYPHDDLLAAFGQAYATLADLIARGLKGNPALVYIAQQARDDLTAGLAFVEGERRIRYLLNWATTLQQLGYTEQALDFNTTAYQSARGQHQEFEASALNNMAMVYDARGQRGRAIELLEQALLLRRAASDDAGEATTLNNMAMVYIKTGHIAQGRKLLEQALPIRRAVHDQEGEASTLAWIADIYARTGEPQEALEVYETVLTILYEIEDLSKVALTLNNMATIYRGIGQPGRALKLYEQALPIMRAEANRAGEASTLNNMGVVYHAMGQSERALQLYEQALPIRREIHDLAGIASTLNNMASVYHIMRQPERAFELFEQALPIMRAVDNRVGEATTLDNMAVVYHAIGKMERALELYEQVLPIRRDTEDHDGEAATLNNIAGVYADMGQPERALELYDQALSILRKVNNQVGEATTINNMARVYADLEQPEHALELYKQARLIMSEVNNYLGEATTLNSIANLLYDQSRQSEAIRYKEQAIAVLIQYGLDFDAAGTPMMQIKQELELWHDEPPDDANTMPDGLEKVMDALHAFINTESWVATQEVVQAQQDILFLPETEQVLSALLEQAKAANNQDMAEMFEVHLALLRACKTDGIAETFAKLDTLQHEAADPSSEPSSSIPPDFVARCVTALKAELEAKIAMFNELAQIAGATTDSGFKALIDNVQKAFFGHDMATLGDNLSGVYAVAWQQIVAGLKGDEPDEQ